MKAALLAARKLLWQEGWVGPAGEPFSLARGPGVRLNVAYGTEGNIEPLWLPTRWFHTLTPELQEVVLRYSVHGACACAGADFDELARVHSDVDFQAWLQLPGRRLEDVLRVFTTAALRSTREKRT